MNLEYSQIDGIVSARIDGTADEVAALVLALQRPQGTKIEFSAPIGMIGQSIQKTMSDITEK